MSVFDRLLHLDQKLSRRVQVAEKPGKRRAVFSLLAHSGDSWFWIAGLLLLWQFGDAPWQDRALKLGFGILVTALIVLLIKFMVRRPRPEGEWGEVYRKTDPHSFPSGHAARAFMLAVLGIWLGPPWFGVLLLVWAPLVTLARAAMGVHYLSDVLAGGIFGALIGWGLVEIIPRLSFLS